MLTVAVVSQKGGAGKSTLALHLAAEGAARGVQTLLIDLDPQGNLAGWGTRRGDLPPDVTAEHPANLDQTLAGAQEDGYGLVVLDTAPHADRASLRAAKAADLILVPCRPATFDLEAIRATLDVCELVKRPGIVILNAAPIRSRVVDEARAAVTGQGGTVMQIVIRQRVAFQHCLIDGRVASEFEPGGAAAAEITALYDDVMTRLHADATTRTPAL
ncbi:ParA family protein [Limobrevibacterium gyesilva]|uniref:ParA family protein n=1 Tax=Limobrevibacterium gyesilva TaxID=2991712 RepID=A0AA41YRH9_9PROT|nr:ParA family protein [Limobrevibacterium gyesilva]MCW3477386.1 ParA family protein [Limobrevibacterium gyesilva]